MEADPEGGSLRELAERIRAMGPAAEGSADDGPQTASAFEDATRALAQLAQRCQDEKNHLFEQAKRRMADLDELHHANRLVTVGTLTAGMAHELGTPLGIVLARAQMIASDEADLAGARKDAEEIVVQVRRMTQMCREVLDYARPKPPAKTRIDVTLVARQTIDLLFADARKRTTRLVMAPDARPHLALGDASKIMQIVTNLVINAAQATAKGGTVTVSVEEARVTPRHTEGLTEGDYVCLHVRDHGSGIRAVDLPRIFETFFTTKKAGEGTGLGLAVSYRIAREHGGWIGVVTTEGEGSCFTLYLPTYASATTAAGAAG